MTTSPVDLDRALDELLGLDPADRLPDRVLVATFELTTTTTQRRAIGVLGRSRSPMSPLLRLMAVAATLALVVGGAIVAGSQRNATNVPVPQPSMAPQTPAPTVGTSPSNTRPSLPPTPALTTRFDSPAYGYSVTMPDGYQLYPASQAWLAGVETQMDSPWLERITRPDNLVTFTARSLQSGSPLTSGGWIQQFSSYPGSPMVEQAACSPTTPRWRDVSVDGQSAFQMHEPCGPFWLIVAKGDRGYVFTWIVNVEDEPYLMAPYESLIDSVRGAIRLTPGTAKSPASVGPSS